MRRRMLVAMMAVYLLATGCSSGSRRSDQTSPPGTTQTAPVQNKSLVSDELIIQGIGLGSTVEQVRSAFGEPPSRIDLPQQNLESWDYKQSYGFSAGIAKRDNRVVSLDPTASSTARTKRGIGIGSSQDDVIRAYGPVDHAGGYRYHLTDNVLILFKIKDGKVSGIHYSWGLDVVP